MPVFGLSILFLRLTLFAQLSIRRLATMLLLVFMTASSLTGCGWNEAPRALNTSDANNPQARTARLALATPAALAANPIKHTIKAGESFYAVAQRYKINLRDLIQVNKLEAPFAPYVGQILIIPQQQLYQVKAGDTLYGIARRYGVDVSELTKLNQIKPPFAIYPDQMLQIPAPSATANANLANANPVLANNQPSQPQSNNISPTLLAPLENSVPKPDEKTDLALADKSAVKPSLTDEPAPIAPNQSKKTNQIMTNSGKLADYHWPDDKLPHPDFRPDIKPTPTKITLSEPPPLANGGFLWPVQGRVVANFGPLSDGLSNDGINIAAPMATAVRAAQNGVVAYSGSELKGFGRLILLKHADGFITAYAHNQENLVAVGDVVQRGQTIAKIGESGNVDRPQLHFQIRLGQKPLDPLTLLKAKT